MADEQAEIEARLEQAERVLRETLSLLHDLADRLDKLERVIRLMVCAQSFESESHQAPTKIERLPKVSTRPQQVGSNK